ncbi:MAG: hypothetical protein NT045_08975 [Candidatus Aureabacteria bacterium]|nr:hypothetical protein [Candidatus Auribacterota bacterium]
MRSLLFAAAILCATSPVVGEVEEPGNRNGNGANPSPALNAAPDSPQREPRVAKKGPGGNGSPKGMQQTPTTVTSNTLEMDYLKQMSTFKGNVYVKDVSGDLRSDKLVVFFDPKKQELTELVATGKKVIIDAHDRRSFSHRAVYTAVDGKIVLTGKPRIIQGRSIYAAERIIIFKDTERIIFEPKARLMIYSDEGKSPLESFGLDR